MIRVLHVLGGLNAGGMETMIMNYYKNINRKNVQFDFLVSSGESFYDSEVLKLGGKIYRVTPMRENLLRHFRDMDRFFKEQREYRIVHIHQGILNLSAIKKAEKYNIPIRIAHSHGIDRKQLERLKLYNEHIAKPKISKLATDYFTCTDSVLSHIFNKEIIEMKKYNLVKNAIDTEKFSFDPVKRKQIRCKLDLSDKFVIGHVGAFLPVKNHEFIVKTFEEIAKVNSNAILLLVGVGELEESIRSLVNSKGLKEKVWFLGRRTDVHDLLRAMDIFLFPSLFEGFPLGLIEAQTSGLKCFVSDTVTCEVDLTSTIEFISLDKGPKKWAEHIINNNNKFDRNNMCKKVTNAGYDIRKEAKKLEDYYLRRILDIGV